MPKLPANLSVDPAVMERGKLYGQRHGTSVSQLVGDFLANLPLSEEILEFSPAASLLYGIASRPHAAQVEGALPEEAAAAYHRHLVEKYGSTE